MSDALQKLYDLALTRKGADPKSSYVAKALSKGRLHIAKKLGEEAVETALAASTNDKEHTISESADMLFHLIVLWAEMGITPQQVWDELKSREGISGIAEKASRTE
jgi:phosphoribosyl-ATP pyrophosphohydrolase